MWSLPLTLAASVLVCPEVAQEPKRLATTVVDVPLHEWAIHRRGEEFAWIRRLPTPERWKLHHAPPLPWEVVHWRPGLAAPEVLFEGANSAMHSRFPPQFCAFEAASGQPGSMLFAWRPGVTFLRLLPDRSTEELALAYDGRLELLALLSTGAIYTTARTAEPQPLEWRPLGPDGLGDAVPMGALPTRQTKWVEYGHELLWSSDKDSLTIFDTTDGSTRTVPFQGALLFDHSGVWNGWLFSSLPDSAPGLLPRELRVTRLADGVSFARPGPEALVRFLPEGLLLTHGLADPVTGSFVRFDMGEVDAALWVHGRLHRIGPGRFYYQQQRDTPTRVLDLGAPEAPARPDSGVETRLAQRTLLLADGDDHERSTAGRALAFAHDLGAQVAMREVLGSTEGHSLRLAAASWLAQLGDPLDTAAIIAAFPVESLPAGLRYGDAAVRVAALLARLASPEALEYLERLDRHSGFPAVTRALESVKTAAQFRAALMEARR